MVVSGSISIGGGLGWMIEWFFLVVVLVLGGKVGNVDILVLGGRRKGIISIL